MSEIIGKIAVLLGIGREGDGRLFKAKPKKPERLRREKDSITISAEARRRLADEGKRKGGSGGGEGAL